jgi:hypothetical protein
MENLPYSERAARWDDCLERVGAPTQPQGTFGLVQFGLRAATPKVVPEAVVEAVAEKKQQQQHHVAWSISNQEDEKVKEAEENVTVVEVIGDTSWKRSASAVHPEPLPPHQPSKAQRPATPRQPEANLQRSPSRILVQTKSIHQEHEGDMPSLLDWPSTTFGRVSHVTLLPIKALLFFSIPDVRIPGNENKFMTTIAISVAYLAFFSFIMTEVRILVATFASVLSNSFSLPKN